MNWIATKGKIEAGGTTVRFPAELMPDETADLPAMATAVCDETFNEGKISADITFEKVSEKSACDIVFFHDPASQLTFNAGIASEALYGIRLWDNRKWTNYTIGGTDGLESGIKYHVEVSVRGSTVSFSINGIQATRAEIPITLPKGQVGLWFRDFEPILVENYRVESSRPKAFVVMQFSSPYNDVYADVIKRVCDEEEVEVVRADEEAGPGIILADIIRLLKESRIVIADISPLNANVFYEVGYAHALNKPTILIAERDTKLPFDVSPFRTLFYENTIAGKSKLEEGLRKHLRAAQTETKG